MLGSEESHINLNKAWTLRRFFRRKLPQNDFCNHT